MNQRLITVREKDNRALADVEGMRQDLKDENAALRREVARLRRVLESEPRRRVLYDAGAR